LRRFIVPALSSGVRGEPDFDTNNRDGGFEVKLSHGMALSLLYFR
jgi:hypothetical protein